MPGEYAYYNEDNSIEFHTKILPNGDEDVTAIIFGPTEKDKNLRCDGPN